MTIPPETLAFARCLQAYETVVGDTSVPTRSATFRVYEKLCEHIGTIAGVAGFQSLAARALSLAKAEAPSLSALRLGADGRLEELGELELETDKGQMEEAGVIFLARLLGLLLVFIGKTLTLRLLQDVWPDLDFEDCDR